MWGGGGASVWMAVCRGGGGRGTLLFCIHTHVVHTDITIVLCSPFSSPKHPPTHKHTHTYINNPTGQNPTTHPPKTHTHISTNPYPPLHLSIQNSLTGALQVFGPQVLHAGRRGTPQPPRHPHLPGGGRRGLRVLRERELKGGCDVPLFFLSRVVV